MTCLEIETLVARHWNIRQNIIVPNVHWGLNIHECDLLIVSSSNYATEIEIKVSKSDLKKDAEKKHRHKSNLIKYLYFAIPEKLEKNIDLIPEHSGIIIIRNYNNSYNYVSILREPQRNENAVKLNDKQMQQLMRLGCMRIWGLKQSLLIQLKNNKELRKINHEHTPL